MHFLKREHKNSNIKVSAIESLTHLTFTYLKSTIETLEEICKLCSKLTIETPFTLFCSVSVANFEQVNVGWEESIIISTLLVQQQNTQYWNMQH